MQTNKIIDEFWNSAYNDLDDGGYISNDSKINNFRFLIEKEELKEFIYKFTTHNNRTRALDVGCGNGRFSRVLSQYFDKVDAIDIAQPIIKRNRENSDFTNIQYHKATLEEWIGHSKVKYDFIYVGGVLMYIEDRSINYIYENINKILNKSAVLVLRESVMTKERVDKIDDRYIAYYRFKNFYKDINELKLLVTKENLAYRVGELRDLLNRLKLSFLFQEKMYKYLLRCLKCKDLVWKPSLNKLVNYYYVFKKEE